MHAADEPTAVWDFEALRKAGLGEIAELPEQAASGPATPADGMAQRRASMIVDGESTPPVVGAPPAPQAPVAPSLARPAPHVGAAEGLSWLSLLSLAVLFGALAYAAMRFLR